MADGVDVIDARELPDWIDLGALATRGEISKRQMLLAQGMELLPVLAAWVCEAAPLAEMPPLLEVVDDTRELIYCEMGITGLVEAVDRLRELVSVFEASETELDDRVNQLRADYGRRDAPSGDDHLGRNTRDLDIRRDDDSIHSPADGERSRG